MVVEPKKKETDGEDKLAARERERAESISRPRQARHMPSWSTPGAQAQAHEHYVPAIIRLISSTLHVPVLAQSIILPTSTLASLLLFRAESANSKCGLRYSSLETIFKRTVAARERCADLGCTILDTT